MLKRLIIAMLAVLLAAATPLQAAKGYQTEYVKVKSDEAMINFSLGNYKIKEVNINGVNYSKIVYEGRTVTSKKGYAELPFINANVQLAPDKNVSMVIADADYTDIKLNSPLLPSKGELTRDQNPELIPYTIAPESIVDGWYPAKQAEMADPFIFREVRGTNVYVYPFAYNAKTQTLRVYNSVKVRMTENNTTPVNPIKAGLKVSPTMNDIYSSMFVNYNKDNRFPNQAGEDGHILVLHTARDAAAIAPYITWKKEKGFKVTSQELATGTNATTLKSTIQTAYTANPNLLYVQLVGDFADLKSELGGGANKPMDPMLGCVVGTDLYPELMIGRFSGTTAAQITVQVEKTIKYEKEPDMNASTNGWYKKGLGIGSGEGSGQGDDGEADYVHMGYIKNNRLLPTTYSEVAEAYQSAGVTSASTPINAGLSIINYCGHGSETSWVTTGYSNTNINASTNGSKLPFIFSVACVNGSFSDASDCFAEAWLKKTNGGAVATLMSSINQPWVPPMKGQDYFNDILSGGYNYTTGPGDGTNTTASDARTTFGSVSLNGNVLMLAENVSELATQQTIQTWTTFGDASLQIRTNIPKPVTISNTTLLMGADFVTKITSNGTPVANAWVTLSQNGNYYRGTTNASGDVTVPAAALIAGTAKLTVTGFNTETKSMDISIVPPNGPYLTLDSYSVSQNGTGNHATYGKAIKLNLKLKNVGISASNNITVTASSTSPAIQSFSDNTENVTTIAANASVDLNNALTLTLKNKIQDQTPVAIALVITDNSTKKTYNAELSLVVDAPKLVFKASSNGTIMPGDNKNLIYTVKNSGHATVNTISAVLAQTTQLPINITTTTQTAAAVAAGDSANLTYPAAFSSAIPLGSSATFALHLTAAAEVDTTYTSSMMIGVTNLIFSENFEGAWAPTGWTNSGWTQGTSEGHNGSKCASASYQSPAIKTLTTKAINLSNTGSDTLSFWWKDDDISKVAAHDTTFCEITANGTTWNTIGFLAAPAHETEYTKFTYALPVMYQTPDFKIRWRDKTDASYSAWGTGVDDVQIRGYITLGIEDAQQPTATTLLQNYPNPFNPETTIRFFNKDAGLVKLFIYNLKGETVATLVNGQLNQGMHSFNFKATGLASGVYVYKLQIGRAHV